MNSLLWMRIIPAIPSAVADGKVHFTKNKFAVNYDGPLKPIPDKYYISPGGRTIHFAYEDRSPIVLKFDKGRLAPGSVAGV